MAATHRFGKELKSTFHEAGFSNIESTASFDEWRDRPGAFTAIAWGEAIGRKP